MNLHDQEWEPEPTEAGLLKRVREAVMDGESDEDVEALRALLRREAASAIPHEVRGTVWTLLLGMRPADVLREKPESFAKRAKDSVSDENSKDQMWKDVVRTRPSLARFKQHAIRAALLRLLSLFCMEKNTAYIQGFNELLAPFILLTDTGENPRVVYSLFSRFVERHAPFLLDSSENRVFDTLKLAFDFFNRLLMYHDPVLHAHLSKNLMSPDLYATSWFVTLFARNFTVEEILALWDLLLLDDHVLGISFFGLSLLMSNREKLLSCDPATLPENLMRLTADSPENVRELWRVAVGLREVGTPLSSLEQMRETLYSPSADQTSLSDGTGAPENEETLYSSCGDITSGLHHYFIWDCRTYEEFSSGHLAQAAFLKLDNLRNCHGDSDISAEAELDLVNAIEFCADLEGDVHICLVGSGVPALDSMDLYPLIRNLTEAGVKRVSVLRGGFLGALTNASEPTSVEVVDFSLELARDICRQRQISIEQKSLSSITELMQTTKLEIGRAVEIVAGRAEQEGTDSLSDSSEYEDRPKDDSSERSTGFMPERSRLAPEDRESDFPGGPSSRGRPVARPPAQPTPADSNETKDSKGWVIRHSMSSFLPLAEENVARRPSRRSFEADQVATHASERKVKASGTIRSPFGRSRAARSTVLEKTGGWGSKAKKGWLSDKSLTLSPQALPRGFTVNIKDDKVTAGLTMFPCKLTVEERTGSHDASRARQTAEGNEEAMSSMYIGLSNHYFIILGPHKKKDHCVVVMMRLIDDVVRVSYRKSRPEYVTFELAPRVANPRNSAFLEELSDEQRYLVFCRMTEGLEDCVSLIKECLDAKGL